ncbi:probable flavonol synthase 6 [Capsella rubella]|nr:probable flavonol synthase 6 [Capsella rubella]
MNGTTMNGKKDQHTSPQSLLTETNTINLKKDQYTSPPSLLTETNTINGKKDQHTSPPSSLTEKLPVIDLSDPNEELITNQLVKASEEWGIFQVVNHGIPAELMQQLQDSGRKFFELPVSEKETVRKPADSTDMEGYFTKDPKNFKAWGDHLLHKISPPSSVNYRYWPKNPSDYREVTEEYTRNVKKLTEKINGYLSKGLGLRREALTEGIGGDTAVYLLRVNYYPPTSDSVLGAPPHTDFCAITLFIPDEVPGFQVFKDDHWIDVEYTKSSVLVLIGDQFMRMSNGRYKNVLHRSVQNKEKTRMSWPIFVEPNHSLVIGPLPELTGDKNPPKFESSTFKEYVHQMVQNLLRAS